MRGNKDPVVCLIEAGKHNHALTALFIQSPLALCIAALAAELVLALCGQPTVAAIGAFGTTIYGVLDHVKKMRMLKLRDG